MDGVEEPGHAVQPFLQLACRAAEAQADVLRMAEAAAGYEQHPVLAEQPVTESVRAGEAPQPRERGHTPRRARPGDVARVARGPFRGDRQVAACLREARRE